VKICEMMQIFTYFFYVVCLFPAPKHIFVPQKGMKSAEK